MNTTRPAPRSHGSTKREFEAIERELRGTIAADFFVARGRTGQLSAGNDAIEAGEERPNQETIEKEGLLELASQFDQAVLNAAKDAKRRRKRGLPRENPDANLETDPNLLASLLL